MQAVEVIIEGDYWDSVLYNGRLYLFGMDGTIHVHDWDRLVRGLQIDVDLRPLATQILTRGRALWAPEVQQLLRSPATARHFAGLVSTLCAEPFVVSSNLLASSRKDTIESPTFPHADVETYKNNMFVGSTAGLYEFSLSELETPQLRFDVPTLRVAASYDSIAVAAGEDGLWQQPVTSLRSRLRRGEVNREQQPELVSDRHCNAASWARFDLVASSVGSDGGFLAAYSKPTKEIEDEAGERTLIGFLEAQQLFNNVGGYMFASADTLVMASPGRITLENWNPYRRREEAGIDLERSRGRVSEVLTDDIDSAVIDGAVTPFGLVLETDDSLHVVASDGTSNSAPEPVNWRCFTRSTRYANHLHVVSDEHLTVRAFTHDYFLDARQRVASTVRPKGPSEVEGVGV